MKQISKSKHQLAQLLIEAGVKQFPEGASWVAQDGDDSAAYYYTKKPIRDPGSNFYRATHYLCGVSRVNLPKTAPNWHQAALSRAEFDQIIAESAEQSKPDADGWIEWKGGECPVDGDLDVSVKVCGENSIGTGKAKSWSWQHCGDGADIIAYRLRKPEQVEPQYCESVARAIPEPVNAPTLDQLLQDYRNATAFAAAKQAEADEAAKMRDGRWKAAQARACELGVHISVELVVDAEMRESEPVITGWRDLRVGDLIKVTGFSGTIETERGTELLNADSCTVVAACGDDVQIEVTDRSGKRSSGWRLHGVVDTHWRFIRRP